MKSTWHILRFPFFGGLAAVFALCSAPAFALPFVAQSTYGGAGDEIGTGVAARAAVCISRELTVPPPVGCLGNSVQVSHRRPSGAGFGQDPQLTQASSEGLL